jgi:hypothetical protein
MSVELGLCSRRRADGLGSTGPHLGSGYVMTRQSWGHAGSQTSDTELFDSRLGGFVGRLFVFLGRFVPYLCVRLRDSL